MKNPYFHCYSEMIPVTSFTESPLLIKQDAELSEDTKIENDDS